MDEIIRKLDEIIENNPKLNSWEAARKALALPRGPLLPEDRKRLEKIHTYLYLHSDGPAPAARKEPVKYGFHREEDNTEWYTLK